MKEWIIKLSKQYSIVTQFTSFVAIEEREKVMTIKLNHLTSVNILHIIQYWQKNLFALQNEVSKEGPSIAELVAREDVDHLQPLAWQIAPPEEEVGSNSVVADPCSVISNGQMKIVVRSKGQIQIGAPEQ